MEESTVNKFVFFIVGIIALCIVGILFLMGWGFIELVQWVISK